MVTEAGSSRPKLTINPVIEFDPSTHTYAAWCDELGVATSGRTEKEAVAMLADAMMMAAAFTIQHKNTLRWELLGQLPYAEMIHGKSFQEIMAIVDGNLQLRSDRPRP